MSRFERFFRATGALDVDKDDLKRHSYFITEKVYDLLVMGKATAKANGRDIIEPQDLPVTKGLQESVHAFRALDEDIELQPVLAQLATWPPLDVTVSELDADGASKIFRLIEALEDCDVQNVYANFDVSDEVMEQVGRPGPSLPPRAASGAARGLLLPSRG
ncbi:DUF1931 family protein [Kribbella steppae]|uniref:DUF1931 family protein n=1 Tax=Kribbella steppae TaxID=2512223 RepID=UPI0018EEA94B|nr:DUF1931 family protein [Kribbella steppae]